MLVKVCPKCGVDNSPNFPVCRRCQTSLAQVTPTEAVQTPQAAGPYQGQSPAQSPPQSPYIPPSPPPQGYYQQASPPPQPESETSASEPLIEFPKRSAWSFSTVFGLLVMIGAAMGVYYLYGKMTAPKPRPVIPAGQVVINFLKSKATGDINQVKQYLSSESIKLLNDTLSGRQAESAGFTREDANEMWIFGVAPTKDQMRTAEAKIISEDDGNGKLDTAKVKAHVKIVSVRGIEEGDYDYLLVIEDGQWKLDLKKTMDEGTGGGD